MSFDFSKFDKEVDLEGLKSDLSEVEKNGGSGDRKEVPHGTYEVKITKLELTESKSSGKPMVTCWFKVLNGEYKDSLIFMNQVITQAFQIHSLNEFLRSLDSGVDVSFESYAQYGSMLMDIMEAIDGKVEFALIYGENSKGYNTFKIDEIFDVE